MKLDARGARSQLALESAGSGGELLSREAEVLKRLELRGRDLAVVELIAAGYVRPFFRFFGLVECVAVLERSCSLDPSAWPIPLLLEVSAEFVEKILPRERVALCDSEGVPLAILTVEECWSSSSHGRDLEHELNLLGYRSGHFLAGPITVVQSSVHFDFASLRRSPEELKEHYANHGWDRVIACQPSRLLHRAETERLMHAANAAQAMVLIQVFVTDEEVGTLDYYTRVRCIEYALGYLSEDDALLSILPNPKLDLDHREVLWRAMLARNAGATHLLVEPEWWHGADDPTRGMTRARALAAGIEIVEVLRPDHVDGSGSLASVDGQKLDLDPTPEILRLIRAGEDVPDWMSFPEVIEELRRSYPARRQQGVAVFFTGLSGAGKSTIARVLLSMLLEMGERTVTLLDGDVVRKHLSSELGFSREHRDINIMRIGYVASEIAKHGGIAICAPIAPYRATRRRVRELVSLHGGFLEVHVATPLETCEARDRKGLYAKARAGVIKEFTGISDPYETPEHAEIVIDTRACTPVQAAQAIVERLKADGFLR